ncbi:MarR family winged helix-turn-helix transcriptional regulator [Methylorubrum salsuginis]|uniref:DNA-binding transcriptional regulator, MarR family n=1 Tax=Methylorubrum salsuginis TaxID=414703 RepID=A0A1I4D478_9HYPH|nr:MarR family transcriptional regulator [Methylorubrum salsuginis]SFK87579.1 DNA-binding transcriptional regulator, MarR family [Methylorubrum salsuginis]
MFFLKDLPTQQMIEGYAEAHGVAPKTIASALAMMRRASLMIRRLESYFSDQGLSQLRFLVLIVIDREPDRETLTVGEITERLDVAGPVVARTLRALLDDGLITQAKDASDARVKHVGLTRLGKEKLGALLPGYMAIIADEMDGKA